jgi:hypothetical protein
MPFDTTAFESTHVIAKWALAHALQPDDKLWYDKNKDRWYSHPLIDLDLPQAFLERQIRGNIAARGWLETAYWLLGSDIVIGNNSHYMLRRRATHCADAGQRRYAARHPLFVGNSVGITP